MSPALIGVGYVIGPELASLSFSGSVLAWGVLVPLLMYFLGPDLQKFLPAGSGDGGWANMAAAMWRYIIRPIAVGGMMVGAAYTLAAHGQESDVEPGPRARRSAPRRAADGIDGAHRALHGIENRGSSLIGVVFLLMIALYFYHFATDGAGGGGRGGGDADRGILLRDGFGQSGRHDRFVQ